MQFRVYDIANPEAAVQLYAKTAECAAVTFLASQPLSDAMQIAVESIPTSGSRRRSLISHYSAADLARSEQFIAIIAHRAREEAINAQKIEDQPRIDFRAKVGLIGAPICGVAFLLSTGDWTALAMAWYLYIATSMLTNAAGTFLASRSLYIPICAIIITLALDAWFYTATYADTWSERVGAIAADGWVSSATGRGAASHHGGISRWLTIEHSRVLNSGERWQRMAQFSTFLAPLVITSVCSVLEHRMFGVRRIYAPTQVA